MLPVSLRLRNVMNFGEVRINFSDLKGPVVAIVGKTGAGKTTLMDSIYAALYRVFPSRPEGIYDCVKKDAQIEYEFLFAGQQYKTLINLNPDKRTMESFLFLSGTPITDGKNGTFDVEIERRFGSAKLALASVYGSQNKRGRFSEIPKADRKELFIAMLGLEQLQVISEWAKDARDIAEGNRKHLQGKSEALRELASKPMPDLAAIDKEIQQQRDLLRSCQVDTETARENIATLAAQVEGKPEIERRRKSLFAKRTAIKGEAALAQTKVAELRTLAFDAIRLRSESSGLDQGRAQLRAARTELLRLQTEHTGWLTADKENALQIALIEKERSELNHIADMWVRRLEHAKEQTETISGVPCKAEGEYASCKFLKDAVEARDQMDDMSGRIDSARAAALAAQERLQGIPALDKQRLEVLAQKISEVNREVANLEAKVTKMESALRLLPQAESAEARASEIDKRLAQLAEELKAVDSELAVIEKQYIDALDAENRVTKMREFLSTCMDVAEAAQERVTQAERKRAQAEAEREAIELAKAQVETFKPVIFQAEKDRKSYDLLWKAFGKTGLQSLEIGLSGPAVSEISNQLLYSCYGPRFSIKLPIQRLTADKSGYVDDFDIYVYDQEQSREGGLSALSGGEQVLNGEAVALAIALFNQQKNGISWQTLFRDEPSSALDDSTVPAYVTMLRKACELGKFSKLFFISHQGVAQEMADQRIIVSNGRVEVVP